MFRGTGAHFRGRGKTGRGSAGKDHRKKKNKNKPSTQGGLPGEKWGDRGQGGERHKPKKKGPGTGEGRAHDARRRNEGVSHLRKRKVCWGAAEKELKNRCRGQSGDSKCDFRRGSKLRIRAKEKKEEKRREENRKKRVETWKIIRAVQHRRCGRGIIEASKESARSSKST